MGSISEGAMRKLAVKIKECLTAAAQRITGDLLKRKLKVVASFVWGSSL
jgi:hypothetical protein